MKLVTPISIESSKLKQVNIFGLFITVFSEMIRKSKKSVGIPFPSQAGEFSFIKTILEERYHNRFQFALYEKNGETFFVKQLPLREYSFENYWFRKEINTLKLLDLVVKRMANDFSGIHFPKIRGVFEDRDRLLAIYEYIDEAKTLDELDWTNEAKAKLLEKISLYFKKINTHLTDEEKSNVPSRPLVYYALSYWLALAKAILRFPNRTADLIYLTLIFIRNSGCLFNKKELVFTHRDLNPSNIILNKKGELFVVDFEVAAMANFLCMIVGTSISAARRENELFSEFLKTDLVRDVYKNDRTAYIFLSMYSCVHSFATVPTWRIDRNFNYLKYCKAL